jgi:hypothetical protein
MVACPAAIEQLAADPPALVAGRHEQRCEKPGVVAGQRRAEAGQPLAVQRDKRPLSVLGEEVAMRLTPGLERGR